MTETSSTAPRYRPAFNPRRWRHVRESLAAYTFILPAFLIIGTFGLFPLLFSVYVSLHRWRIIQGPFIGLANYVKALDGLAYGLGLWLAVLFGYLAIKVLRETLEEARVHEESPWLWGVPALITTVGIYQLLIFAVRLLPEILAIGEKVKGQRRTQELFLQLLREAWQVPEVRIARITGLLILIAGIALAYGMIRWLNGSRRANTYYTRFIMTLVLAGCAIATGLFTLSEIQRAYAAAAEAGEPVVIWPQVLTLSAGIVILMAVWRLAARLGFSGRVTALLTLAGLCLAGGLRALVNSGQATPLEVVLILLGLVALFLSWYTWRKVGGALSTGAMVGWVLATIGLILAAWALIAVVPPAIQAGNDDWWEGLLHTVYYAMFTVPIELILGLFLAILLFQEIKGKGFFRLIYFLPYITNPVAAASVFRVIFSSRVNAPMNALLEVFGMKPLLWLDEPKGILQLLLPTLDIPAWLAGPSLALVVVCIYGIWTFAGYNTVVFLAGLGSIPRELYEASAIDGAGRWQQFRHITFPLLSPTTYFLTLVATIGTFKAFNHLWVLRSGAALGTTDTASIVIFTEFNRNTRYGYASALALILMGFILVLTMINNRIAQEKVFYG